MSERQAVTLTKAYLLHARPYRDSSVIAEVFSHEFGRIALVARGVRRPKSKIKGLLQPFRPLLISWVTRSALGTLTELENDRFELSLTPQKLLSAYYVNELIMRALRSGDSQPEIYELYQNCLVELSNSESEAVILRCFERDLLNHLGYGLHLETDCNGKTIHDQVQYVFDIQDGASPSPTGYPGVTYAGTSLRELADSEFSCTESLRDAKKLLRIALDHHLGSGSSRVRQVMTSMNQHRRTWGNTDSGKQQ